VNHNQFILRLIDRSQLGTTFIPGAVIFPPAPAAEAGLRKALACDEGAPEWAAVYITDALLANPVLATLVQADPRNSARQLQPQVWPSFLTGDGSQGVFRRCTEWPPASVLRLTRDETGITVSVGSRFEKLEIFDEVTAGPWPTWSGLRGTITFDGYETLTIIHRPSSVSWEPVAKAVEAWGRFSELEHVPPQLHRFFWTAPTAVDRVAAAAAMLILSNNDVIWE